MDDPPHWIRDSICRSVAPILPPQCAPSSGALEELTNRKLTTLTVEKSMPTPKRVDHQAIVSDHAAGHGPNRHRSKVRCAQDNHPLAPHAQRPEIGVESHDSDACHRGARMRLPCVCRAGGHNVATIWPPSRIQRGTPPNNGHATTTELEQLFSEHWNRLPILERVRILLGRG
jgi:hypothetical protein